jgi:pimeloyl-ACP methyl ester carboxylesterase
MEINGSDVAIEAKSVAASFQGTLSDDGNRISGTWKQGRGEYPFAIYRVSAFDEAKHVESWKGTMTSGTREFDFRLRVFKLASGDRWARLDSVNEGVAGLFAELADSGDDFSFAVRSIGASFKGTVDKSGDVIDGLWTQGGVSLPLKFSQSDPDEVVVRNRPQNPEEPFPYRQEQVKFENSTDHVTLAGTLTIPEGSGPWPAMVLISGSGAQDRDETILGHKPFLIIADWLTRKGIAVLRYDDRGTGESTGNFAIATSEDFSRDAMAAIDFLKLRTDIRKNRIGLIGHSEGGMIAPMVATRSADVAMIVLLAGTGVDGARITLSQTRAMSAAAMTPPLIMDAVDSFMEQILEHVKTSDSPIPDELVEQAFEKATAKIDNPAVRAMVEPVKTQLGLMESPWFRYFARFDPAPVLGKVECPVLALNGKKDMQVLADLNIDAIERALIAGGNQDFEVHKLDNLNHLFQETSGSGLPGEYGTIEQTFSPAALELIASWIVKHTR